MKKLIPALCMLLVAACLMGTSTYAWFSANENVTATGMSVKAATDGGLAIGFYTGTPGGLETDASAPASTAYGTTATLDNTAWTLLASGATVVPTSYNPVTPGWFTATAANNEDGSGVTATYKALTAGTDGNVSGYYQKAKFSIKSMDTSSATYKLFVRNITVTNVTDTGKTASTLLNKSLRVVVKTSTTTIVFAPGYESSVAGTTFNYVESVTMNTATPPVATAVEKEAFTATSLRTGTDFTDAQIFGALTSEAIPVEVYLYYDGEDENCTTKNAMNIDNLQVSIQFGSSAN